MATAHTGRSGRDMMPIEDHPHCDLIIVAQNLARHHGQPKLPELVSVGLHHRVRSIQIDAARRALSLLGTIPMEDHNRERASLVRVLSEVERKSTGEGSRPESEYVHWRQLAADLEYEGHSLDLLIRRYGPADTILDFADRIVCGGRAITRYDPHRGRRLAVKIDCALLAQRSREKAAERAGRVSTSKTELQFWRARLVEAGALKLVGKEGRKQLHAPAWFGSTDPQSILLDVLRNLVRMMREGRLSRSAGNTRRRRQPHLKSAGGDLAI